MLVLRIRFHTSVSTVGRDEAVIREYIRHQEVEDRLADQLPLLR